MANPTEPGLIIFDMDGTLIAERFIFRLARRFGFETMLEDIIASHTPEYEKTRSIAALLAGLSTREITDTFDRIPLSPGAAETAAALKEDGHTLAIISDSYTIATERLKERLGFDYTLANELVLKMGKATGEVKMPLNWPDKPGCLKHAICKLNAMLSLAGDTGIPLERTVAVGDNIADICMLEQAWLGIAFNPKAEEVERRADVTVTGDLRGILDIIRQRGLSRKPRV
ncbi:MAG: HAD family phosphatase [Dehalococcoidia bacterium]|jgi:phosphoserine phosphatase